MKNKSFRCIVVRHTSFNVQIFETESYILTKNVLFSKILNVGDKVEESVENWLRIDDIE